MRILYTDEIDKKDLLAQDKLYLYNGLDCLICREIFDEIYPLLDEVSSVTYNFMRALQAPVMEMQLRGCYIDKFERAEKLTMLEAEIAKIEDLLNHFANAAWNQPLNAKSPMQKAAFFYDFAKCTEISKFDWKKMESRRTTERAAIEKLIEKYPKIALFGRLILAIMDKNKQVGTLRSGVDPDGYFRASFLIAGTETGRMSSKKNVFDRGSNFQNWAEHLRSIFTAPEGQIPNREKYNIPEEYR